MGETKESWKEMWGIESNDSESYEFNLSDFALFLSVMRRKEAYEATISIILDEPDVKMKEVKVEEVILNHYGKRAIRLDAWGMTTDKRQINMEMENSSNRAEIAKRSRYYQGLLDTPILKSGKKTKYKQLPSTVIIFITQDDIFGKDCAKYTFTEQCEEIEGLRLEDGTKKIFLNMSSKNGSKELVSLLQYMKETTLNNPEVEDERIVKLDRIVREVKESEEWEDVQMNILEIGISKGELRGQGLKIISLVRKKMKRNMSPEEIADLLEEEPFIIKGLYDILEEHPEWSDDEVYKAFKPKA